MSMIPKIIHYCWFGGNPKPELVERCMESWYRCMPSLTPDPSPEGEGSGWTYMEWNESNFDVASAPLYVRQAYEAKKYAFVSDYVRLWALEQYGGVYMDVDFEVYKSFEDLLNNPAFAGYEGSKRNPVMMGVIAAEPHNPWIQAMLHTYESRPFIKADGSYDMTPNTGYFTDMLEREGLVCDGVEKDFRDWLHVYPVEFFCPGLTTGENLRCERTYCEHKGLHSWSGNGGWKQKVLSLFSPQMKTKLIKLKRALLG